MSLSSHALLPYQVCQCSLSLSWPSCSRCWAMLMPAWLLSLQHGKGSCDARLEIWRTLTNSTPTLRCRSPLSPLRPPWSILSLLLRAPIEARRSCSCCSWWSPPVPVAPASLAAPGALVLITFPWSWLPLIFSVLVIPYSCLLLIFAQPMVSAFTFPCSCLLLIFAWPMVSAFAFPCIFIHIHPHIHPFTTRCIFTHLCHAFIGGRNHLQQHQSLCFEMLSRQLSSFPAYSSIFIHINIHLPMPWKLPAHD